MLLLHPVSIVDASRRISTPPVLSAIAFGATSIFFHGEGVYPESSGFWLRGRSSIEMTIATSEPDKPVTLQDSLRPQPNTLTLETAGWREEIALVPTSRETSAFRFSQARPDDSARDHDRWFRSGQGHSRKQRSPDARLLGGGRECAMTLTADERVSPLPSWSGGHRMTLYTWGRPRHFPSLPQAQTRYFDVAPALECWHCATGNRGMGTPDPAGVPRPRRLCRRPLHAGPRRQGLSGRVQRRPAQPAELRRHRAPFGWPLPLRAHRRPSGGHCPSSSTSTACPLLQSPGIHWGETWR